MPLNWSESFVCDLCDRSILEPWAYMNPVGDNGKELVDALVVFENHVVLLSVKEYSPQNSTTGEVASSRWERKALTASIKQLLGAQRYLSRLQRAVEPASGRAVELPPLDRRRLHLVAVSLGGRAYGRFGSRRILGSFVHVLDEDAVVPHFAELDTVSEFLEYLEYRELSQAVPESDCFEEDWLGHYLLTRESLAPEESRPLKGSLSQYLASPAIQRAQEVDPASFFWDRMVLHLWDQRQRFMAKGAEIGSAKVPPPSADAMDGILRHLAIHPRAERRFLGSSLLRCFLNSSAVSATVFRTPTGPAYIILCRESLHSLEEAQHELLVRCLYVLECYMPDRSIIGIASTPEIVSFSSDARIILVYLKGATNSESAKAQIAELAKRGGYFRNVRMYDVEPEMFGIKAPTEA